MAAMFLAVGAAWAPAAAEAPKQATAGIVVSLQGKPRILRAGAGKFEALKRNSFVGAGDQVKTGQGEGVGIALLGGAEIRINESSTFVMESGGSGGQPASLDAKVGQAWTRLLHGMSRVQVRSNMAVCSVRGTEADIDVHDKMTVKVYEGLVDLENPLGRQSLSAGQISQASAGAAPSAPRRLEAQEFGTWQNGLKPSDLNGSLKKLQEEAQRTKTLQLQYNTKDGKQKKVEFKLEKKK
jgi:hypothetical protein